MIKSIQQIKHKLNLVNIFHVFLYSNIVIYICIYPVNKNLPNIIWPYLVRVNITIIKGYKKIYSKN